jgi:hypothetical protein
VEREVMKAAGKMVEVARINGRRPEGGVRRYRITDEGPTALR